MMTIILT